MKLENLNDSKFQNFAENEITDLSQIKGGDWGSTNGTLIGNEWCEADAGPIGSEDPGDQIGFDCGSA